MASFDARALTEPIDRAQLKAYRERLRGGKSTGAASMQTRLLAAGGVIAVVAAIAFATGGGSPVMLLVGAITVGALIVAGRSNGSVVRPYRLDRFARANGLTYHPGMQNPQLPGMIFHRGSRRRSSDLVRGERPRFVEFGNYRYTTGSGKSKRTHRWGYLAIHLDTPLPHIVLDAEGNNGLFGSNLPTPIDADQKLSLEGDFDRYFSLYCPAGYERDALYLFTPDIMARFIDNAAALDVEIVDQWLFLYTRADAVTLDPQTWAWLFGVVGSLLDKLDQWSRWRDERLATGGAASPPAPAPPGVTQHGTVPLPGSAPHPGPLPHPVHPGESAALPRPISVPRTPPPGVAAAGRRLRSGIPWLKLAPFFVIAVLWLLGPLLVFGFLPLLR